MCVRESVFDSLVQCEWGVGGYVWPNYESAEWLVSIGVEGWDEWKEREVYEIFLF